MTRLEIAIKNIQFARDYTNDMLRHIHIDDWFRMPGDHLTHIAWQVGHLAMAQYRLAMERIRGIREEDEVLIPGEFMTKFGKGSVPSPDSHDYPSPADIVGVYDAVHKQVREELPALDDAQLDEPPIAPHPLLKTKFDALCWASHHEMLHAGQIGLLRRLFGEKPLR
jgi:hypothetical protein